VLPTVGSGDDEDSDVEEDADRVRGNMDASATPRTADAPKNSPFYKPWSFSEVEALLQNNVPWGEIEVETPMETDHPQWRSAVTSTIDGHEHVVTVSRSQEPPRESSGAKISGSVCGSS
jgi:hypothetical protein